MSVKQSSKSYIAGFLDGDGSIYVKLTKNDTYKYKYQVCPYVVFYQSRTSRFGLEEIKKIIQAGYIRERNDGISEYIIGDVKSIKRLMNWVKPHVIFKRGQVQLMLDILEKKKTIKNVKDFLELCTLIDRFKELNYSKKRTNTIEKVKLTLRKKCLLTP